MKGKLIESNGKWAVYYTNDIGQTFTVEVKPGRINDLSQVGTFLASGDEVEFEIYNTESFPYQWAVPLIAAIDDEFKPRPTASLYEPKKITKFRITLWLSGFHTDEIEIECDHYDTSNSEYYYFYDRESNNGQRKDLGCYPINRTIIHEVEKIEVTL